MSRSTFSGPVLSGTQRYGAFRNIGNSMVLQTATMNQNSTNNVDQTFYLPAGSQITTFVVDVLTAFDSATSATLTIGLTAGGTEYVTSVNAKTAGRAALTFTGAQLTAMLSSATNTSATNSSGVPTSAVVVRIAPVGATTAGQVQVTIHYAQPDDRTGYQNQ